MKPNMDINTPEGMAAAVEWQQAHVDRLTDQGRWVVPRSGSIIVIDKMNKQAIRVAGLAPEPAIRRVFEAMGWQWIDRVLQ